MLPGQRWYLPALSPRTSENAVSDVSRTVLSVSNVASCCDASFLELRRELGGTSQGLEQLVVVAGDQAERADEPLECERALNGAADRRQKRRDLSSKTVEQ